MRENNKVVLVVAVDPATRALARSSLANRAAHILECPPDDFEAFVRSVRFDVVVMIGPTARELQWRLRDHLDLRADVVVASTVAEALREMWRP